MSPPPRDQQAAGPTAPDLDALLPAIVAGDPYAFARWVAGAERPLRLSLRPLAEVIDAEAVLQECLLRVWQVAPRVVVDGDNSLLRFAHRVARNLALDEVRRARVAPASAEALERALAGRAPDASAVAPDPHLRAAIARCQGELPDAPGRALAQRLASYGTADDATLAGRARMRPNTFLQNITRARRLIARCLERAGVNLVEVGVAAAPGRSQP